MCPASLPCGCTAGKTLLFKDHGQCRGKEPSMLQVHAEPGQRQDHNRAAMLNIPAAVL